MCLALQSQVVQFHDLEVHELLHDQIQVDDLQLSQTFEEVPAIQQELSSDNKLTHEELDDKVDDASKLTSSDYETADIETEDATSQSKI